MHGEDTRVHPKYRAYACMYVEYGMASFREVNAADIGCLSPTISPISISPTSPSTSYGVRDLVILGHAATCRPLQLVRGSPEHLWGRLAFHGAPLHGSWLGARNAPRCGIAREPFNVGRPPLYGMGRFFILQIAQGKGEGGGFVYPTPPAVLTACPSSGEEKWLWGIGGIER